MRGNIRCLAIILPLLLAFTTIAKADTCNSFLTYDCAHSTPNLVHVGGGVASGQSVGVLLTSDNFTLFTANGSSASDMLVIAAFVNSAPTGTVNGLSFTSLSSFPESGAVNAILSSLAGLGICTSNCNLSFGFVDLHTALAPNGTVTVSFSGIPAGTAIYGLALNSSGQIVYITPNSEAGIVSTPAVPEPSSLYLLGTGLLAMAGLVRRRYLR